MNESTRSYARIALAALIVVGTVWVLAPFLAALLFAAILCLSTWPLFTRIEGQLKGRTTFAALLTTLILALIVLGPMSYLAATIADGVAQLITLLKPWFESADHAPPDWLAGLPVVGGHLDSYWRKLAGNQTELANLGKQLFEPTRNLLTASARLIGQGLLEHLGAAQRGQGLAQHPVGQGDLLPVERGRALEPEAGVGPVSED